MAPNILFVYIAALGKKANIKTANETLAIATPRIFQVVTSCPAARRM